MFSIQVSLTLRVGAIKAQELGAKFVGGFSSHVSIDFMREMLNVVRN
jgi:hypothetical protein